MVEIFLGDHTAIKQTIAKTLEMPIPMRPVELLPSKLFSILSTSSSLPPPIKSADVLFTPQLAEKVFQTFFTYLSSSKKFLKHRDRKIGRIIRKMDLDSIWFIDGSFQSESIYEKREEVGAHLWTHIGKNRAPLIWKRYFGNR